MAQKEKQQKLTIRMPTSLKEDIEELAEEEIRSANKQAVLILKEGVARLKAERAA